MINYKSLSKLFTLCCNIVTVIILFINIGCQTPQNKVSTGEHIISDSTLIQINVDPDGEESYAFDSLIDDISYIKLETNSDCLIGNIHQILCSNEYIFIMDVFVANAVYCFDKHGNFVRRIGKVGQGPGEYSRLCKMCLTSDQKQIVLYDWNRLHYYDLNGKHIKDVSPSFYANDIELINNDFIAGFIEAGMDDDSQRQMLSVYDKDFKLLYREFPSFYNEVFHLNNGMHPLRSFGNDIYLKEPWTHNIYKIEKDRCYEKYRINILNQIRLMDSDKIIHLWLRLYKYENTETSHINKKTNYLCFIFRRYGINPNSSKIDQSKIKDAPLFQKEEKDTAAGIRYWAECITHIKESSASTQIKDLFSQLNFYDYRETDTECILTFKTSYNVYNTIETYFIDDFQRVLLKYFPANLKVCYNVK